MLAVKGRTTTSDGSDLVAFEARVYSTAAVADEVEATTISVASVEDVRRMIWEEESICTW